MDTGGSKSSKEAKAVTQVRKMGTSTKALERWKGRQIYERFRGWDGTWWLTGCEESGRRAFIQHCIPSDQHGAWHIEGTQLTNGGWLSVSDLDQWEALKGNASGGTYFVVVKREIW